MGFWPLGLARFPTGAQSQLCECEFQAQREEGGMINAVQKGCSYIFPCLGAVRRLT